MFRPAFHSSHPLPSVFTGPRPIPGMSPTRHMATPSGCRTRPSTTRPRLPFPSARHESPMAFQSRASVRRPSSKPTNPRIGISS